MHSNMNHHRRPLRTAIAQAVLLVTYGAAHAQTATADDTAIPAPSLRQVDVVDSTAGAAATPARRAQSSSRLGLSVLETPRSVSVIDGALMEQQMATTERDVLRNASGVATRSEYYGSYSQFSIRGLWANNTYNFLRDGAKFVHLMDPPLFNIERVEVIKGPAALEFGQVANARKPKRCAKCRCKWATTAANRSLSISPARSTKTANGFTAWWPWAVIAAPR